MSIFDLFKPKKKFEGKAIREVWDFRLSKGCPYLYCDAPFWVIRIWANSPEDGKRQLLQEHITDIVATGNPHDHTAIAECYKWLYTIRNKFSRDDIEDLKPKVVTINEANSQ